MTITHPHSLASGTELPSGIGVEMDVPLPRGLREEAHAPTFQAFLAQSPPSPGPLQLNRWICVDEGRPATRWGPQARNYQATLAFGDRVSTSSATACGPVAALTEMLYQRGIAVELTAFHQLPAGEHTATFLRGSDGGRSEWGLGLADDPTSSALHAVIACANRLLSS